MKSIFTFILLLVITTTSSYAQGIQQLDRYLMSADKLVVRSGPGANYNEIAEVPKGTQVYVISSGYGDYSTIQYKSLNGFVLTNLLMQDNSIAEAEAAAKLAEEKKRAAAAAAAAAVAQAEAAKKAAEEAARKAIAQAEALKRQAEAEAAAAAAAAAAANQQKSAAERRREAELAETQKALEAANKRAEQSGSIAAAPIESATASAGKNRNQPSSSSRLTKENKFSAWKKRTYKSGATPESFANYKGKYDYKLDNYLKIAVGKNTDVVVKLVKMGQTKSQDETVRIVYINSGATQYIRNIPEGQYYCVIAYGKEWRENGPGKGTFTINALYEKGQDILDFNTVKTAQGINMPNFSLSLDLLPNGTLGNGNDDYQDNITPDKFNQF